MAKMDNNYGILASEHALMRMLKGSSIVWIRVNLEHYYNLGLIYFPITKKKKKPRVVMSVKRLWVK